MIVQHQDVNVGPGFYKHLHSDELLITKIWYTIQGEGPFAGRPAIFIRLAGCNRGEKLHMSCEFCDTAFYFGKGARMKFHEIVNYAKSLLPANSFYPLVVITGGEPMMQDNLVHFIGYLNECKLYEVQIESNGDRLARNFVDHPGTDDVVLVVSPKVVNREYRPLKPEVFNRATVLKFVVSADPTSPYHYVPEYADEFAYGISDPRPVFLSPLTEYVSEHSPGVPVSMWRSTFLDREKTRLNYAHAAYLALKSGFRLSIQMHLFFELE